MRVKNPNIKNIFSNLLPQTPFAAMSSLDSSSTFAVAPSGVSLVTGCNLGSIQTTLHTLMKTFAVRSQISFCLIVGKPPLAHERACSTENLLAQLRDAAILYGVQPYRRANVSWKPPSCRVKPCSSSVSVVNHDELSFYLAKYIALFSLSVNFPSSSLTSS